MRPAEPPNAARQNRLADAALPPAAPPVSARIDHKQERNTRFHSTLWSVLKERNTLKCLKFVYLDLHNVYLDH